MLNVILWLPLAVGLACFIAPRNLAGWLSFAGSLVSLGLAIALLADFSAGGGLQHIVSNEWIPSLGVRYELAVDGLSIFMVLLTAIGWTATMLYSAFQGPDRARTYFFQLGLAQTAVIGAFLAQDLLLFVLFFDLMLIPFYFLIGGWGTGDRVAATIKMIIYTLVGSLLMLIAAIATAVLSADAVGGLTFNIQTLASAPLPLGSQQWIFWFFAAAFLVKMPAFLVHGWMADAYRACPLPVLALLSGVLSKVAAYGFLRIVLPTFPDATIQYQEILLVIAVLSILYGSAMAFTQFNVRLIAGYSSIAQLGFITLGIFALRPDGADGAVIQMFNHGLVVLPVFFIIALLYERFESEDLREMGGMAKNAPILAVLFIIVTMATLAIPGSANFVGEFYILAGVFENKIAIALVASIGVALAAFYALRLFQRSMHNRLPEGVVSREITLPEAAVIAPLVACIIGIALYPALILDRSEAATTKSVGAVAVAACAPGALLPGTPQVSVEQGCVERYGLGGGNEPAGDAGAAHGSPAPDDSNAGVPACRHTKRIMRRPDGAFGCIDGGGVGRVEVILISAEGECRLSGRNRGAGGPSSAPATLVEGGNADDFYACSGQRFTVVRSGDLAVMSKVGTDNAKSARLIFRGCGAVTRPFGETAPDRAFTACQASVTINNVGAPQAPIASGDKQ